MCEQEIFLNHSKCLWVLMATGIATHLRLEPSKVCQNFIVIISIHGIISYLQYFICKSWEILGRGGGSGGGVKYIPLHFPVYQACL